MLKIKIGYSVTLGTETAKAGSVTAMVEKVVMQDTLKTGSGTVKSWFKDSGNQINMAIAAPGW